MFKFIKNKFLFILLISITTLVILIVGAFSLYKDTSSVFTSDGYILETTTKTNTKYYFSSNTKYKENVDNKIAFSDNNSNKVAVSPASFVHYLNGNVGFLQQGALVNLADINSPMVSYYNITSDNIITKETQGYTVTSNDKKIDIESFVGRISDNKYIIAGKNISLKVPKVEERISGEYFEILYIEEGIIKIDNQEASYQVTAQDSYIYIGDDITISLGDGKISYQGDAKMLLSQITINGDENINLDVDKNNQGGGSGDGSGTGTGEGSSGGDMNEDGIGTGEGTGEGDGTGDNGTGGNGTSDNGTGGNGTSDNGTGGNGTGGNGNGTITTESPQIELIEANVTSTTIDLSLQLNNASLAKETIVAYLTNVATGTREYAKNIDLVNGTFKITKESLSPSTEYALSIIETGTTEKQYFQKTFKTKELGITLEKVFATDNSLSYKIIFDENSDVTMAHIQIYDNNGSNNEINPNEMTVSKDDLDNTVTFTGLKSNTSYSVNIDTVWINNAAYSNVYTINRIDTTLKKTPKISGIKVEPNAEEVKFTINLGKVEDKDKSIVSYTYNIYLADDITLDNLDPEVKYSITKADSDALVLNLNEIEELNTGVDYRCKIIAQYNDNEMIREVSTDYSSNFLIKSKPNISFELKSATMNKVEGTISLIDANCTVPMNGRSCSNSFNNFTLRYYKLKDNETTDNDTTITFDPKKLTSEMTLTDLSSNTTYAVKVFGNYYDDDNVLHTNVQIGDAFYVATDKSDNLHFEIIGDNTSGYNKDGSVNSSNVVTFDARLTAPQDSTVQEEIATITLNLYSGRYNAKDKLIGKYIINDKTSIEDFFSNITITNRLFTDTTNNNLGELNTLEKLIQVTNNSTKTLNGSYTVEVEDVYDSTGKNKITIENNIYTFNLTPSYYLDARIETNPKENYITVTSITKENLTEEEYESLSGTIKNLDELDKDTVVGITIENSLSDIFVDSAFTYEKVVVNYTIYNETTKKAIKTISVDMGNKYQPKEQTIYLDSSELDDGKTYFTRGYKYKIGYDLSFTTEDGSNPNYENSKLYKILPIERQKPIYTQYISTSNSNGITYQYSFNDLDNALANNNFYYKLDDSKEYLSINNSLIADNQQHEVTVPLNKNSTYSLYYANKSTDNKEEYIFISTYDFETELSYDNANCYTIINDNDNVLKLRLENNDVTSRAVAYKVVISDKNKTGVTDYVRYFLASKLNNLKVETSQLDEEGNPITEDYKYIAIDYAAISKFMGIEMKITLYSYYDNGLVGINQTFDNGLVLKNRDTKKNLNIYNGSSNQSSFSREELDNMGILLLKEPYQNGDETIYLYNKLISTNSYNPRIGATYYDTDELSSNVGIKYNISYTSNGIVLNDGKTNFNGYNARVLKEATLKTEKNTYKFNTIVPTIQVTTNKENTINSIKIAMTPSGIYGKKQFIKNGVADNKVYVEIYSDEEEKNKLTTIESPLTITGDDEAGYKATIAPVEYKELTPATTYYFAVYAYIGGTYTRLYDSTSTTSYITKTYESTTLDAKGIIKSITFGVTPTQYTKEYAEKTLTWKLGLKNTDNYKIRFELYKPNGTTTTIDPETGEDVEVTNFEPVNFDGSNVTTCDPNKNGTSGNGYINNCYISVDKNEVQTINNVNNTYKFTGNDFVFGGKYYKLIVYAIPYTNNRYDESNKIVLYQNDSLETTGIVTSGGMTYNLTIPFLNEATFTLSDSLTSGYSTSEGYYISFKPIVTDNYKVIKSGKYTIKLKDEKGATIQERTETYDRATGTFKVYTNNPNDCIKFTHLSSNTLYYIEFSYETYRNNVGFTEEQKTAETPFTDFTYTPIDAGITLGTITAGQASAKSVMLTYNGSSNMVGNIIRVHYTINLKGGSSKVSGDYIVDSTNPNIFTIASDKTPKLLIDTSDSKYSDNTSFTFRSGNTYIISTQYYYEEGKLLTDQNTGNTTFTTILNT